MLKCIHFWFRKTESLRKHTQNGIIHFNLITVHPVMTLLQCHYWVTLEEDNPHDPPPTGGVGGGSWGFSTMRHNQSCEISSNHRRRRATLSANIAQQPRLVIYHYFLPLLRELLQYWGCARDNKPVSRKIHEPNNLRFPCFKQPPQLIRGEKQSCLVPTRSSTTSMLHN